MQIRRIVCRGFKTYRDLAAVEALSHELNCVVGFNGAGKSSIFHAVVFVLCDAPSKSTLLYEGSLGRALSGFVELEVDNASREFPIDSPTVSLRRTVDAGGGDEFLVNGKSVNKTEYLTLLQTAGLRGAARKRLPFYIVEQGRIAALVSDGDRFELFQEAAGTDVYAQKRVEALAVLADSECKLVELRESLDRVETHKAELERDCAELSEFASLRQAKVEAERVLGAREMEDLNSVKIRVAEQRDCEEIGLAAAQARLADLVEAEAEIAAKLEEFEMSKVEMSGLEKAVEKVEEGISKTNCALLQQQSVLGAESAGLVEVEQGLLQMSEKAVALNREIEIGKSELNSLKLKLGETKHTRTEVVAEIARLTKEEAGCSLSSLEQQVAELEIARKSLVLRGSVIREEICQKKRDLDVLVREEIPAVVRKWEQAKAAADGQEQLRLQRVEERNRVSAELTAKRQSVFKLKQAEFGMRRSVEQLTKEAGVSSSAILRNTNSNTRTVLAKEGVVGLFGNFLSVPPMYRKAVEAVGKAQLFHVLIESDSVAEADLGIGGRGKVTLVPLNRVPAPSHGVAQLAAQLEAAQVEGCVLSTLLGLNTGAANLSPALRESVTHLIDQAFGRTVLVESLAVGMRVVKQFGVDTVTLDGDQISRDLIVKGGRDLSAGVVGAWQGSLEVQAKLAAGRLQLRRREKEIGELEMEVRDLEAVLNELHEAPHSAQLHSVANSLTLERTRLEALRVELDQVLLPQLVQAEHQTCEIDLRKCELELMQVRGKMEAVRAGKTVESFLTADQRREQLEELKACLTRIDALVREIELRVENEGKRVAGNSTELTHFVESRVRHLQELRLERMRAVNHATRSLDQLQAQLDQIQQLELVEAQQALAAAKLAEEERAKAKAELVLKMQALDRVGVESEIFARECKLQSVVAQLRSLDSQIVECMQTVGRGMEHSSLSTLELRSRVVELNKELSSPRFELVNKKSIEQFDRVRAEFADLQSRKADLDAAGEAIQHLLRSLNEKEASILTDSFAKIQESFGRIFNSLVSGRGDAKLQLDIDTKSISVQVSFGGQLALTRLSELSGGQRTVVALCFLLSLQRPGGFFVLDEVDAALDANYRSGIASALREESVHRKVQFIFTSFRPEFCGVASKHFLVSMHGGTSRISPLDADAALMFVSGKPDDRRLQMDDDAHHLPISDNVLVHGA